MAVELEEVRDELRVEDVDGGVARETASLISFDFEYWYHLCSYGFLPNILNLFLLAPHLLPQQKILFLLQHHLNQERPQQLRLLPLLLHLLYFLGPQH